MSSLSIQGNSQYPEKLFRDLTTEDNPYKITDDIITHEPFQEEDLVAILPCRHIVSSDWLSQLNECPTDRKKIIQAKPIYTNPLSKILADVAELLPKEGIFKRGAVQAIHKIASSVHKILTYAPLQTTKKQNEMTITDSAMIAESLKSELRDLITQTEARVEAHRNRNGIIVTPLTPAEIRVIDDTVNQFVGELCTCFSKLSKILAPQLVAPYLEEVVSCLSTNQELKDLISKLVQLSISDTGDSVKEIESFRKDFSSVFLFIGKINHEITWWFENKNLLETEQYSPNLPENHPFKQHAHEIIQIRNDILRSSTGRFRGADIQAIFKQNRNNVKGWFSFYNKCIEQYGLEQLQPYVHFLRAILKDSVNFQETKDLTKEIDQRWLQREVGNSNSYEVLKKITKEVLFGDNYIGQMIPVVIPVDIPIVLQKRLRCNFNWQERFLRVTTENGREDLARTLRKVQQGARIFFNLSRGIICLAPIPLLYAKYAYLDSWSASIMNNLYAKYTYLDSLSIRHILYAKYTYLDSLSTSIMNNLYAKYPYLDSLSITNILETAGCGIVTPKIWGLDSWSMSMHVLDIIGLVIITGVIWKRVWDVRLPESKYTPHMDDRSSRMERDIDELIAHFGGRLI